MYSHRATPPHLRPIFGVLGAALLFLIIDVKAVRWAHLSRSTSLLVGVAPSLLGPAGLIFLVLSSAGRLSRWPLLKIVSLAAVVSLALEFVQALPRPGILRHVHYTFDWYDLAATVVSVLLAYLVAWLSVRAHTCRVGGT
jgi:hypothetical protein